MKTQTDQDKGWYTKVIKNDNTPMMVCAADFDEAVHFGQQDVSVLIRTKPIAESAIEPIADSAIQNQKFRRKCHYTFGSAMAPENRYRGAPTRMRHT